MNLINTPSSSATAQVSEGDVDTTSKRPSQKFPKAARLLNSNQFKHLKRRGARLFGTLIAIDFRQGKSYRPRLGITVSRKFGKAHDRNRFKRVVREAFREYSCMMPSDLELNVSPCSNRQELSKQAILVELKQLISKIAVFRS